MVPDFATDIKPRWRAADPLPGQIGHRREAAALRAGSAAHMVAAARVDVAAEGDVVGRAAGIPRPEPARHGPDGQIASHSPLLTRVAERENGFTVHLHETPDLEQVKARLGIPEDLEGCHTATVEGYRVEGHVPAEFIVRLLEETPDVTGIAVPGMPAGSPGMEGMGGDPEPYDIVAFAGVDGAERSVFGSVRP